MTSTNRCLPFQGTCRACARKLSSILRGVTCAYLSAACLAALIPPTNAAADDPDNLATSGLFLSPGSSGHQQGPFVGTYNLNTTLGAQRFYNKGLTGTGAVMANIEAGSTWNGHETLAHVQMIPTSNGALGEFDRHATWVGGVMGGRPTVNDAAHDYQRGMAPDAQLFSGSIATGWAGTRYSTGFFLNFADLSTLGPYRTAMITGLYSQNNSPRMADVINSSYVYDLGTSTRTGTDNLTGTLDALINENPRTLLTWAAGNTLPTGAGPN